MNRSIVRLSEIVRDIKEESRIEWRFIMLIYLIVICRHESIPTSKDLSSFLLSLHCSSSYKHVLKEYLCLVLVEGWTTAEWSI